MAKEIESESTQVFQFDPVVDSKPARESIGIKVMQGFVAIGTFAVVVAMFSAGVVWVVNRTPKPSASGGAFGWFGGQNKTGGRPVETEYYDWTKEPGNGVKSNRR